MLFRFADAKSELPGQCSDVCVPHKNKSRHTSRTGSVSYLLIEAQLRQNLFSPVPHSRRSDPVMTFRARQFAVRGLTVYWFYPYLIMQMRPAWAQKLPESANTIATFQFLAPAFTSSHARNVKTTLTYRANGGAAMLSATPAYPRHPHRYQHRRTPAAFVKVNAT